MSEAARGMIDLSATEIEGMLGGHFTQGATVPLVAKYRAVCVDGTVWKVVRENDEVVGFVKPENCVTCTEVERAFERVLG